MDSPESQDEKKKRAAKRYPYPCVAECEADGQKHRIQLINISTSGVQFAAGNKIEITKNQVRIRWGDIKFGAFSPTFLLVREIHNPKSKELPYFYGAQYSDLSSQMKESLLKLLKNFKEKSEVETKKQVEKITPGYLFAVIDQGEFFLKSAFTGASVSSYFETMLKEIKEYERAVFTQNDSFSKCIQNLTLYNFHCNILKSLASVMAENAELQMRFFQKIQGELQKIGEVVTETEDENKKLLENTTQKKEEKKQLQEKLSESSNRLFYTIQGMLHSVIEVFVTRVKDSSEFKPIFDELKAEYDRMVKPAGQSVQKVAPASYARRTKRPEEFSRVEAIVDVRKPSRGKKLYYIFSGVLVLGLVSGIFSFLRNQHNFDEAAVKAQVGIEINILDFEKFGNQINFTFSSAEWTNLSEDKKLEVYQKALNYLDKDKMSSSVVMSDEKHNTIQVLYKGQKLQAPVEKK